MISDDDFALNVWHVLQKIKRDCEKNTNVITYDINLVESKHELQILRSLAVRNAIEIHRQQLEENLHVIVALTPLQPQFNNVFNAFKISKEPYCVTNSPSKQLSFTSTFLKREISHFQSILVQFQKAGMIDFQKYRVLMTVSNTIRILISQNEQIEQFTDSDWLWNSKKDAIGKSQTGNYNQQSLFQKPIPIRITDELRISGLNERLDALKPKSQENSSPKFPYKIPAGTHWNNITIRYIDNEKVEIYVKKLKHTTDFKEMGMCGKGNSPGPNQQWIFLRVLAQCNGELTIKDSAAKDKYKKQKQILTEILRNYFLIDYDPFYPYQSSPEKTGSSYKIKLLLIPPPIEEKSINNSIELLEEDSLGIREFLKEETPLV